MKKLLTLLLVSVLAAPAVVTAADFEGKVTMKLTGPKDTPASMTYSIKGTATRMDMASKEGRIAMLTDSTKSEMTILMLDQQMFMTQPIPKATGKAVAAAGAAAEATVEKTSVTEKILGYDCVKYISKSKNTTTEIWVTDQLGSFAGMGGGGNPMGGGRGKAPEGQAWEKALSGLAVFPLRVVSTDGSKQTFRMEATAIDKTPIPASAFVAPEGFQDLSAMMRGMMPPGMKMPGGN
ncbi:MAG: DUF4412 domain-containing protein [Verrucomicrobia bacterium]|nr:DUF4412 domain-containing protein [Verrucomicrobiota bacterium]